jgi:hypothetical protein
MMYYCKTTLYYEGGVYRSFHFKTDAANYSEAAIIAYAFSSGLMAATPRVEFFAMNSISDSCASYKREEDYFLAWNSKYTPHDQAELLRGATIDSVMREVEKRA